MLEQGTAERPAEVLTLNILSRRGRTIRPKTLGQKRYVDAIDQHTIVFGIGPAGTGKTYLAMAKAVQALQAKQVNRIILTRPAVEAGERLGFLPGTLFEKIDPYLRPLYDALHDMIDPDSIPRLMANGTIEVAPLAYMRGRTLNDAFIILDEAQNTTPEQMKMFLTRLGFGSKIVVTGDITQVDLPGGTRSGLRVVREILDGVEDVHFAQLTSADVVRHRLVSDIVDAYERWDAAQEEAAGPAGPRRARARRPSPAAAAAPPALTLSQGIDPRCPSRSPTSPAPTSTPTPCSTVPGYALDEMGVNPLAELSVLLVDVAYMAELNHRWMGGDGPTDVLAFPMEEGTIDPGPNEVAGGEPTLLGDVVLCPEVAAKQAAHRRALRRRRAAPAHRARRAAPARLRPRRAGRGARDVRAAGQAARQLARRPTEASRDTTPR